MSGRVELYETPSRVSGEIAVNYTGPRFGWKLSRLLPYPVWLARALPFSFSSFFCCDGGSSAATVDAAGSMQTWMEC